MVPSKKKSQDFSSEIFSRDLRQNCAQAAQTPFTVNRTDCAAKALTRIPRMFANPSLAGIVLPRTNAIENRVAKRGGATVAEKRRVERRPTTARPVLQTEIPCAAPRSPRLCVESWPGQNPLVALPIC